MIGVCLGRDVMVIGVCSARSDFGKLIQVICNCCGPQTIYVVFLEKLKGHVAKVQSNPELVSEWSSIECIITCVGDLASTLKLD